MPQTVNGGKIQFGVGFKTDTSGLQAVEKSLSQIQNMKFENFKGTEKQFKEMQQAAQKTKQILQDAFNSDLGTINISKFTKGLNDSFGGLDGLKGKFEGAGVQGQVAFDRVATAALKSNIKLKQTKSLVDSLGQTFMNSIKWNIASSVINSFTGSLQQAFGYVKNLDSSLTNIRIVTGDSREQMAAFAVEANNAAAALGKTTRDYTDAALSFYQQGLNDEEVRVRTEASLKAQNITQGKASVDELTAVWNGYQVSIAETEQYVDKLAAVADKSASDMSQLATAMSKVAATANVMGVDMDQLTAQIATIVATTRQAPQTVGNALKTIYARINDIKAGTDEAQTSLGNYSSKMGALGFSVLDANGNLRQTGQVMEEIGNRWTTLTKEQQVYLAQTMAGQRQYNQLISLFDNWTQYSELLNVSLESEGTLNQKNSRYMESLAAHMEQFTAARQNLMDSFFNADSFKNFVDFGTKAVNIIAKLVDAIGGGGNALLMLGTTASRVLGNTVAREVTSLVTNFRNARDNAELFNNELAYVQNDLNTKGISADVEALKAQYGEMARYWGVMTDEEKLATRQLIIQKFEAAQELKLRQNELTNAEKQKVAAEETTKAQEAKLEKLKQSTDLRITQLNIQKQQAQFALQEARSLTQAQERRAQAERDQSAATFAKKLVKGTGVHIGDTISGIDNTTQAQNVKTAIRDSQREAEKASKSLDQLLDNAPATLENSKEWIEKVEQQVEKLKKAMANTPELDKFQEKLKTLSSSNQQNVFGSFKTVTRQLNDSFKQENDQLAAAMQKTRIISQQTVENATREIENIDKAIEKAEQAANKEGQVLQKNIQKAKQAEKKAGKIVQANQRRVRQAESHSQNVDQDKTNAFNRIELENLTKGFTKLAGGIASTAGAIKGLSSAAKSFKEGDYLSAISGGMMSIVAGASGVKNIVDGFKTAAPSIQAALTNPWVLAGAAAVAAGVVIYKWYNKDADAAERAAKTAEQTKKHYQELKDTLNEFNDSMSTYNEAVDALNKLSKGTEQWNEKLKETNQQVLQLLQKYPQLSGAISQNVDGLLVIDKTSEAYKNYLNNLEESTQTANIARINAQQASNTADRTSAITNLSRQESFSGLGWDGREQLEKIITAIEKRGQAILGNTDALKEVAHLSDQEVKIIQDNNDKILTAINAIEANTKSVEIMSTTTAQDLLKGNRDYQNTEDRFKDQFAKLVGEQLSNSALDENAYSKMSKNGRVDNTEAIANRYAEILGQQVKKNFIGSGYSVKNAITGQWEKVSAEFVKSQIAAADALDNLDSHIEKIKNNINAASENFKGLEEAALKFANVNSKEDLNNISLAELSANDIENLDAKKLIDAFGLKIDEKQLENWLKDSLDQVHENTENYIKQLPLGVQKAFDILDKNKMSDDVQRQVGGILKKVFTTGQGVSKFEKDIAESLNDALKKGKLDQLLSQNFDQMKLDDVTKTFESLGITVPKSTEALQAFLKAMKTSVEELSPQQIYNNVHDVIDKKHGKTLDFLDQIDADAYQKLVDAGVAVDGAFVKLTDGTYKFIGDAEEFYKQANQTSLQPFIDEINRLRKQVAKGSDINYQSLSQSAIKRDQNGNWNGTDYQQAKRQIDALKTTGAIDDDKYAEWNDLIDSQQIGINQLLQIERLIEANKEDLQDYQNVANQALIEHERTVAYSQQDIGELQDQRTAGNLDELLSTKEGLEEYAGAVLAVSDAEGIAAQNVKFLAKQFVETASKMEGVNDELQGNVQASYDIAAIIEDTVTGIEALQKAWKETIKEGIQPSNELLADTGEIFQDIFNQDIDASFIKGHLEDIQALANGDVQAIQRIGVELANTQLEDIAIQANLNTSNFDWDIKSLKDMIAGTDWGNIEIGTEIHNEDFYPALQEMIANADMTEGQINNALGSIGYQPEIEWREISAASEEVTSGANGYTYTYKDNETGYEQVIHMDDQHSALLQDGKTIRIPIIKGSKFGRGNLRQFGGSRVVPKAPSGGKGGGGKKGGSGNKGSSAKKPKQEKPKEVKTDPYHKINRQLDDQQRKLKKLDNLEDRLIPRDRLAVLEKESKEYDKQIKLLKEKEGIANSELARLKTALTGQNASNVKVQFQANGQIANYNDVLKGAYDKYNEWVTNVYNKMTAEQQQAAAAQKQSRENALKQLEQNLQEYEKTLDLIDDIEDALQAANQAQAALVLTALKYRMQVREAAGDLQREFQDFSDKVIKDLADDDYLAQVQSKFNKIMSYVNSKEIEERKKQIDWLRNQLDNINKGIESKYSAAEVQSMLDDLLKQQMNDLQEIKDLQKEIQQQFIDALDNAKDKQDQVMDQYGRINDQIQRGIDLTTKLYGDKAYAMLDKYYEKQNANNLRELQTLKQQENYWRAIMSSQQTGSQAWKAARENLESVIDAFGDKLEQALDNLATWWENQVDLLVNNLNNTLTNGLGTDYLDMQWDQMSKFDDDFLDAVNRNFATNEIRDMYQEGLDSLADSPAAQAKLNDLMNDQLKILEEKENLTQYDIDRAKALYDIEMKRFELEELRNSKTTMRLRRDSQGNYTYQYVEDEEKVSDLQKSLAEAENNLYNLDKEHYKETLENMYDVYKEYIDERRKLEQEYAQARQQLEDAQTEQEKEAAQARIKQLGAYENTLNEWYEKRAKAYGEDILYNKIYVGDSAAASLGLTDLSPADKEELVNSLVPYASSAVAALAKNISEEGGFFEAVIKPLTAELTNATTQLLAGTDVAKDIYDENAEVRDTQTEALLQLDIVEMNKAAQQVSNVSNTLKSIDEWLKENFTQEYFDNIVNGVNTMQQSNVLKGENAEQMGLGGDETIKAVPMETSTQVGAVPFSINGSAVSADDAARLEYWQGLLDTANSNDAYATALANYEGALQTAAINKLVSSLADYYQDPSKYLTQAVTINADFPNVESWQEIVEAIKNLSLTASQQASSTIRTAG